MTYALRLSEDQSERTLALAIRRRALVYVEPLSCLTDDAPNGTIDGADDVTLSIRLEPSDDDATFWVPGQYCGIQIILGEDRYVCSAGILEVEPAGEGLRLTVTRPQRLQVIQRRNFWRARLAQSSSVTLVLPGGLEAVGPLCNVSGDGMACLAGANVAHELDYDQSVRLRFELPGCPQRFDLPARVRSKTASDHGRTIVGVQFVPAAGDRAAAGQLETLREFLVTSYQAQTGVIDA